MDCEEQAPSLSLRSHAAQRLQIPRPRLLLCFRGSFPVGIPSVELYTQDTDTGVEAPKIQADHIRNSEGFDMNSLSLSYYTYIYVYNYIIVLLAFQVWGSAHMMHWRVENRRLHLHFMKKFKHLDLLMPRDASQTPLRLGIKTILYIYIYITFPYITFLAAI